MILRPRDRRRPSAGVSRAALVLFGAVIAAALVLAGGAIRSGGGPSPAPSASGGLETSGTASLPPVPTAEPTLEGTPAPPEPTEITGVRGDFVGPLGHVETCPILYERDGVFELVLPDGYRSRLRGEAIEIIGPDRTVVATEGDLLGVNGNVRQGGSFCMVGPQLHVSRIVEVVSRGSS